MREKCVPRFICGSCGADGSMLRVNYASVITGGYKIQITCRACKRMSTANYPKANGEAVLRFIAANTRQYRRRAA